MNHKKAGSFQAVRNPKNSRSQDDEPGCSTESADGTSEGRAKDAFDVDTTLIPQAALEDQETSELQDLGLSVFNQDTFEQGIMEQVDDALAKEEEQRLRNILQRELKTINDDIVMAKKDLDRVNEAAANIEDMAERSRDAERQLESINRQKQNKLKQIKTLKVRRENVLKKLSGFDASTSHSEGGEGEAESTFDKAFDLKKKPKQETERERMIRTGEMTPFGTIVKAAQGQSSSSKPKVSEYEKSLGAREPASVKMKKDFDKYLKRKSSAAATPKPKKDSDDEKETSKKVNRFDEKDDRVYDKEVNYGKGRQRRKAHQQIRHNFSEDGELDDEDFRDHDEFEDEGDEYEPSRQELREDSSEEEYSEDGEEEEGLSETKRRRGRHRKRPLKKPRPLPKYREHSDEDEPVRTKVRRDMSIRQERDDADPEDYNDRLIRQQKLDRLEEKRERGSQEEEEEEEGSDAGEFDGGFTVPRKLWKKLFKYQKTGVRWLWELHCQQAGGIVGDEMGLGKTIQTISFLAALRTSQVRNVNFPYKGLGPTIVVCPTTVMHQWLKEFHKWWPDFRVAILHSSCGHLAGSESDLVRSIAKSHGILITSYNTLVIHQELVLRFNWHYVILDEGHKIRNPDAKVTLCCKQFRTPHRIILSGSPIQNNLKELWSLFDFVFPGKLGTLPDFMQHFSIPIVHGGYSNATQIQVETAYRCACVLRDTINPYLIRRMKADVKKNLDLPSKNEQVLFCRLTDEQWDVYQEYLASRECSAIMQGKFQIFTGLIKLRKICNHPDLLTGGPNVFHGNLRPGDKEYEFGYWRRSGKMIVVEALLRLWHKQGHRVLLFSQSKAMLSIMEQFVQEQGYTYLTMDGGTSISSRQPLISQYNNDPSIFLFLLTTRVGGLGVNLTGADRVIIYDPDWNPSTDTQARERAWRIGQKRQVTIYRLLTSGTIEEKIYHRQIFKQFLTNRVLKDPKQRRLFKSQDMYELFTLGSKDNAEGTETSALFAGTGSNVRMPPRRKSRNRFDEIEARKKEEEEEEERKAEDVLRQEEEDERVKEEEEERVKHEEEENSTGFDKEELERMKELARNLSRKMEREKKLREGQAGKDETEVKVKIEEGISESEERKEKELSNKSDSDKSEGEVEDNAFKVVKGQTLPEGSATDSPEPPKSTISDKTVDPTKPDASTSLSTETLSATTKPHSWLHNGKKWTIPSLKTKKSSSPEAMDESYPSTSRDNRYKSHHRASTSYEHRHSSSSHEHRHSSASHEHRHSSSSHDHQHSSSSHEHRHSSASHEHRHSRGHKHRSGDEYKSPKEEIDEQEKKRLKRKRKHKDARFEGERIPNLVKHRPFKKAAGQEDEDEEEAKSKNKTSDDSSHDHDDVVLRELFKKTGIHGAMKHDKIMDSSRPDYAIVEAEAEKVAREAAAALKKSRQQCASAISGLPTWTGQHGGVVQKARFGQKKNSLLVNKNSKSETASSSQTNSQTAQKQQAEKEKLFDGSISGNVALNSKNSSMTSNDLLSRMRERKRISTAPIDEDEDDDFLRPDQPQTLETKDTELLEDIRNYVAFMATKDGEATTQEIVLNFGKRLPKGDAPKFKAMLNQVCDFQAGVWRLKVDFR